MKFQNVIKNNVFLRCFSDFLGLKSFKKNLGATHFDKGFRLVYKFSYLVEDKFWSIFADKGGPLPKKSRNFVSQPDMTIYTPIESPCRV